jgi:large subunit ribosomal protein L31
MFIDQIITEVYIGLLTMKKAIHPINYRPVVFQDLNNGQNFLTRSTVETSEVITLDGVEYPLVKVHISSASHPFFTGEERIVDVEGRVDKFKARAAAGQAARERRAATASKQDKRKIDRLKETEAKQKTATNTH